MAASDLLEQIVAYKRSLIAGKRAYFENLRKNLGNAPRTRYQIFKKAVARPGQVNLIAEIKKASPSRGLIRDDFDPVQIAKIYRQNGAAAVSVLTEDKYFLGKPAYLKDVSDEVGLPALMKDFVIDEAQVWEGAVMGASAILLIVAILTDEEMVHLMSCAHHMDLDTLVEVHDEAQLERAVDAGADLIGINSRNLRTLEIDLRNFDRLIPKVPAGTVIVAESGLKTREDIARVGRLGAHAVLIGETLMSAPDIAAKMKEIF